MQQLSWIKVFNALDSTGLNGNWFSG